ncbi:MAG: hypothetical protein QME81_12280 [bacterium]|nr:hypothetical protein [bacterium]
MKMLGVIIVAVTCLVMITPLFAQAQRSQDTLTSKEIMEEFTQIEIRLARLEGRLEEGLKALNRRMDDLRSELKGEKLW